MLHALIWIQGLPCHRGNLTSSGHSPQFPGASGPIQATAPTTSNTPQPLQRGSNPPNDVPPAQRALTQWTGSTSDAWTELQQWMQFVPQRLHERLRWSQGHSHLPPQTSAHLLLYAEGRCHIVRPLHPAAFPRPFNRAHRPGHQAGWQGGRA